MIFHSLTLAIEISIVAAKCGLQRISSEFNEK